MVGQSRLVFRRRDGGGRADDEDRRDRAGQLRIGDASRDVFGDVQDIIVAL